MGTVDRPQRRGAALAGVLLAGCAVALALGVYGKEHDPALKPLFLAGFSGMLPRKSWLATTALVVIVRQVTTSLWMFLRLPGAPMASALLSAVLRWSPGIA